MWMSGRNAGAIKLFTKRQMGPYPQKFIAMPCATIQLCSSGWIMFEEKVNPKVTSGFKAKEIPRVDTLNPNTKVNVRNANRKSAPKRHIWRMAKAKEPDFLQPPHDINQSRCLKKCSTSGSWAQAARYSQLCSDTSQQPWNLQVKGQHDYWQKQEELHTSHGVNALCACSEFLPQHENFEANFAMARRMNVVSFFFFFLVQKLSGNGGQLVQFYELLKLFFE